MKQKISICWLRRDLRLEDNAALFHALQSDQKILLLFIFDTHLLSQLPNKKDRRVSFIHEALANLNHVISNYGASVYIFNGTPIDAFAKLESTYEIDAIYANHDYEPYAIQRDLQIRAFADAHNILFKTFKDQVVYEKAEILKPDGNPYTVFTPYANAWKRSYRENEELSYPSEKLLKNLYKLPPFPFPTLPELGFDDIASDVGKISSAEVKLTDYEKLRNFPAVDATSRLGVHLRFGTISIRHLVKMASQTSETFLNELIWREFFMMILYHFPRVATQPFKQKYDAITWRNNENEFRLWCEGKTGYALVDAGMRQLNATGWMHNRVRMVVAGFLTKHLLIDYRWGELYFAQKLIDFELASNNGNWQWAAGCGCDAAPYFRIFNPALQLKKFDADLDYVCRWIPEYSAKYLPLIVDHEFARKRALAVYKEGLGMKG